MLRPFADVLDAFVPYALEVNPAPALGPTLSSIFVLSVALECTRVVSALSHLLLGSPTGSEIYRKARKVTEVGRSVTQGGRWALARFPLDSPWPNAGFCISGTPSSTHSIAAPT